MNYELLTPMMRQWHDIRQQNPDAVLLYRLGDFYEMFFEDAVTVSRELDITLTGRDCGLPERAPMCGVPHHAAEGYIARLVAKGFKLAICEQTEDPAAAKGLVRREVLRVISPGTVIESEMLDESRNNYLAAVLLTEDGAGLCFCDISTGTAEVTQLGGKHLPAQVVNELAKFMPTEVLLSPLAAQNNRIAEFLRARCKALVEAYDEAHFGSELARDEVIATALTLPEEELEVRALGAALHYLRHAQKTQRSSIRVVESFSDRHHMRLDASSRRNLELCETQRTRDKKGTLLWVLDKTRSAMGKRLLRAWLERPLTHLARITRRQTAVQELCDETNMRLDIMDMMQDMHDLERLMARVVYQSANARQLRAICACLALLPDIKATLAPAKGDYLQTLAAQMDACADLHALLDQTIVDEPPFTTREGGMIRPGYCAELDELRAAQAGGQDALADIQTAEQERTGVKKLKVGYNRVFGYYIEVGNAHKHAVPDHYIRKQTLANCERYITQELKDLEAKVLGAGERAAKLELEIFTQLREELAQNHRRVHQTAGAVAALDVLCSFADCAVNYGYCKPEITVGDELDIIEGRHPVVERMLDGAQPFVSNNTQLGGNARCMVITGPNMAGKSTYMRQVALITLMAQVGSFVPAERATIGMCDAIFTRVGASDDLAAGQSTFMVEMAEVASILQLATAQSLIIFDEIGRGTSTYDGMAIARAVLEHTVQKQQSKALFATHYHELTALEQDLPGVQNYAVAVKKRGDEITFLRRVVRGAADGSFGVEVAKLAGVPNSVVKRAKVILAELEQENVGAAIGRPCFDENHGRAQRSDLLTAGADAQCAPLQDMHNAALVKELKHVDVDTLTPIEALTKLHEFVGRARG